MASLRPAEKKIERKGVLEKGALFFFIPFLFTSSVAMCADETLYFVFGRHYVWAHVKKVFLSFVVDFVD